MNGFFSALDESRQQQNIIKQISSIPSNYVGSKRRMLRHIWKFLDREKVQFDSVFDAFSGSSMVSLLFKNMGKTVIANDLLTSSAITAICLLENENMPISDDDINFLCNNKPDNVRTWVLDNYKDRFFTEEECLFLDRYRRNVEILCGKEFFCGLDLINKATLASIPNSNFSVYGKSLKALRSVHQDGTPFHQEKWRDTTRKRRDENNNIMFESAMTEMRDKYRSAFSLFAMGNHITQKCFLGGRYYSGQTIAQLEHRLKHPKNGGQQIMDDPVDLEKFKQVLTSGEQCCVFNSDIIDLLQSGIIETDMIYIDPPYGGSSSDYATLYRFLEEYLYEEKLEDIEHVKYGSKRFSKSKGYQEQFEHLLSLCGNHKYLLISYNDSSYADLDTIISTIKNSGRDNVIVYDVPYTYQYRKGKNVVDVEHFRNSYAEEGHEFTQRGTEYLILAS